MTSTCSYCGGAAVSSIVRPLGDAPANPKHHATKADVRKQSVVHFCPSHWARLVTFLDVGLKVS